MTEYVIENLLCHLYFKNTNMNIKLSSKMVGIWNLQIVYWQVYYCTKSCLKIVWSQKLRKDKSLAEGERPVILISTPTI